MPIFFVFSIYQKENAWTEKHPDIKILLCINKITQVEYQEAKQIAQGSRTNQN
jgi:hypothetical protein